MLMCNNFLLYWYSTYHYGTELIATFLVIHDGFGNFHWLSLELKCAHLFRVGMLEVLPNTYFTYDTVIKENVKVKMIRS